MHNNHNYLFYDNPGGEATVKYRGLPLRGRLRSTACCAGPSVIGVGSFELGVRAKALRFLEKHNSHNYLYYGDPGGEATVKYGGLPLRGRLRSTACCDGPSVIGVGSFEFGVRAKALRFLEKHNSHNYLY